MVIYFTYAYVHMYTHTYVPRCTYVCVNDAYECRGVFLLLPALAAAVEQDSDAERVLVAFGYGANLPTTSKRRLQQSVQLARRVLQLERVCSSLRRQLEGEEGKVKQLSSEVCCIRHQRPYPHICIVLRTPPPHTHRDHMRIKVVQWLNALS